jgi:hypothetical protein
MPQSKTIHQPCPFLGSYGERLSRRDHRQGGFALSLGHKDISLVLDAARRGRVPMPFASLLQDRLTSTMNQKDLNGMDWSAIGIEISRNAGTLLHVGTDPNQRIRKRKAKNRRLEEDCAVSSPQE